MEAGGEDADTVDVATLGRWRVAPLPLPPNNEAKGFDKRDVVVGVVIETREGRGGNGGLADCGEGIRGGRGKDDVWEGTVKVG